MAARRSGPQGARIAKMLYGGQIELGAVHTYLELFARYFIDLTPNVALIAGVSADRDGNLYTGPNTEDTPTVGGDFYTWVLVDPTNAGYGSYAYGLSGFSTLDEFAGGDGRMAIHGTVDESSIGGSVSHGCIRVPDAVAVEMAEQIGLPLGVPVSIQA